MEEKKIKKKGKEIYMNNPALPTPEAEFEWTPEMIKELKKCKENLLHFAENYFYIINLDEGKQKIKLHSYQKKALRVIRDNKNSLFLFSRQSGKLLNINNLLPTPEGYRKNGDLKDGDYVFDEHGKPVKVLKAHPITYNRKTYKLTFDTGEEIIACDEHLWYTQTKTDRKSKREGSVKTTAEIVKQVITKDGEPYHRIPLVSNALEYTEKELEIDPYILGVWLGDGASAGGQITVGSRDVEEMKNFIINESSQFMDLHIYEKKRDNSTSYVLTPKNDRKDGESLAEKLRKIDLKNNKHIPEIYLRSSKEQRLELLRGLIDSDGYIDKKDGTCEFSNNNKKLIDNVADLIRGLGYKVHFRSKISQCNGKKYCEHYTLSFKPEEYVCKLNFKRNRQIFKTGDNSKFRARWHYIKNVEEVESVPMRCITVDSPTGLYLVGENNIPTHNSTIATIYMLWTAIFNNDQRILLVANKESTAKEIFRRIRTAYEQLPNWLKSPVQYYGLESLELSNGSRIGITTTTGTAGRGSSANLLFIDEAAFVDAHLLDDFWASVYPIISSSTKSKVIMASTPKDTTGLFYKLYDGSVKGTNNWAHMVVKWDEIPGRTEKWKRETIAALGDESVFNREFCCQFDQVGENALDVELLDKMKKNTFDPLYVFDEGRYLLWENPNENKIYVAGVDVAEGVGKDATVIQILDITNPQRIKQVGIYHNNKISPVEFTPKLREILQHWGDPLAFIERNNCGGIVVDNLKKDFNYENIVNWGVEMISSRKSSKLGIVNHINTKYSAIMNQRYWMNTCQYVQINDIHTVHELSDFVKTKQNSWAAKNGSHDDRVMALVWALLSLHDTIVNDYFDVIERDENNKPSVIKAMDYGVKYFMNPLSIYTNEKEGSVDAMPLILGGQVAEQPEIDDLYNMGWKPLYND